MLWSVLVGGALVGCQHGEDGQLTVLVSEEEAAKVEAFLSPLHDDRIVVEVEEEPEKQVGRWDAGVGVALTQDDSLCAECFRLEESEAGIVVVAGGIYGRLLGLSVVQEAMGYGFLHPTDPILPTTLTRPTSLPWGEEQSPAIARRGLHLHTLHPIDGLPAFWDGTDDDTALAWTAWALRNRANHLQWVALDNITQDTSLQPAWEAAAQARVSQLHDWGMTAGIGVQLFGTSNLQLAWDFVDVPGTEAEMRPVMTSRLEGLAGEVPWDVLNLSFGEFSGVEPDAFLAAVELARQVALEVAPQAQITTTVHVGADVRVEYNGQDQIYYFLVQYADPSIVPWVHSVMFYNLFDDAGGAYWHDEFDEHRAFLLDRLQAGQPVGYFPETAYWVAFDDSVPVWFPLYLYSRWRDLDQIHAAVPGGLQDHVLFSTGAEWGYWANDALSLRMSWSLPQGEDGWEAAVRALYAPAGEGLGDAAIAMARVQYPALIGQRLAPYLASRDLYMDIGEARDIRSQPYRPSYAEIAAMSAEERAAFEADILGGLDAFARDVGAIPPPAADTRYAREVADGLAVTQARAVYIAAIYRQAVGLAEGQPLELTAVDAALAEGRSVVQRRHADLHDPLDGFLTGPVANTTLYDFGYLYMADTLCYWERERALLQEVSGLDVDVPGCIGPDF